MRIVIRGINPEPWAIGTVNCWGKGKGTISPNIKVLNYQKALQEELSLRNLEPSEPLWAQDLHILYFRSTERGQPADVTNLNKATEDALQGILFANDRINRKVTGEIIEQHPHVEHVGLIIEIKDYDFDPDVHDALMAEMVSKPAVAFEGTDYTPPDEDYL